MSNTVNKSVSALALLMGIALLGCDHSMESPSAARNANQVVASEENRSQLPAKATMPEAAGELEGEHGHKVGAHGGIIVPLGRDSYHAEAVFEKGGTLRLYTLGNEESKVIDVQRQTLRGFAKAAGENAATPFELIPEPQSGDADGRTSQFVGALPEQLLDRDVEITIPSLNIDNQRFRVGFKSAPEVQHLTDMPSGASTVEERELYLMPGGVYTAHDIKANGSVTASLKFRGMMASHDMKPREGDKICPVTMTKANPKFTWIVGGRTYEFCCPPCVDEFVRMAKRDPEAIRPPTEYVKH